MSLQSFADELAEAGGVKHTSIDGNTLRVKYFANPSNYSTVRGKIRREYPNITHVDTETDASGHSTLIYEEE